MAQSSGLGLNGDGIRYSRDSDLLNSDLAYAESKKLLRSESIRERIESFWQEMVADNISQEWVGKKDSERHSINIFGQDSCSSTNCSKGTLWFGLYGYFKL